MNWKENINCFAKGESKKIGFLVDSCPYFRAFCETASLARKCLYISGWDFDLHFELQENAGPSPLPYPSRLKDFLNFILQKNPQLKIYILCWDYPFFYGRGRDLSLKFHFQDHFPPDGRIQFLFDYRHPFGASHHEKYVIVDETLFFLGGIDLCQGRWDNPLHRLDHPNRILRDGHVCPPIHDIQVVVEGELTLFLVREFKERWFLLTGKKIPSCDQGNDLWPPSSPIHLENLETSALSRTKGDYRGKGACREIENLYKEAIKGARHFIYIENQYFTSHVVARALAEQIKRPHGPEILLVLGQTWSQNLEFLIMGGWQNRLITQLKSLDHGNRLRVLTPTYDDGKEKRSIKVHSKLLIVDHRFLTLGSANLNNRSMGLDSEINFSLEEGGEALVNLEGELLAEHLGGNREEFRKILRSNASLISHIDDLFSSQKAKNGKLNSTHATEDRLFHFLAPSIHLVDPPDTYPASLKKSLKNPAKGLSGAIRLLPSLLVILVGLAYALILWVHLLLRYLWRSLWNSPGRRIAGGKRFP